jgi:hypothetical protein
MLFRLLVALALVTFTAPAYAQTQTSAPVSATASAAATTTRAETVIVGTLLEADGPVSLVVPGAEPKALKLNDPVHMNDVIETGADARAFILLIDNTELTLGENAQFTVDEYVFDETNEALNKGRYSVLRGAFLYTSGLLAKKENPDVTVATPFGSVGIRGTTFWGGEIDGEYGILVTDGQVSVQTERGRILVNKEQGTMLFSKTAIPARAGTWAQEKIDRAVQTIALKDSTVVRERVTQYAETQKQDRAKYKEYLDQRLEQKQLDNGARIPTTRIDNAPRPQEKKVEEPRKTPIRRVIQRAPQPAKPGVLDDAAPTEVEEPVYTPDPALNKPFSEETMPRKSSNAPAESLLKAAPTNAAPATTPAAEPVAPAATPEAAPQPAPAATPDKGAAATPAEPVNKEPSGAPQVDLPVMGDNEAQTNELKEQQHLQQRRPAPAKSKADSAL